MAVAVAHFFEGNVDKELHVSIRFNDLFKRTYHLPLLDFVSLLLVEVLVITGGAAAPVGTPIEITTGPLPSGFVRIVSSSSIFLLAISLFCLLYYDICMMEIPFVQSSLLERF